MEHFSVDVKMLMKLIDRLSITFTSDFFFFSKGRFTMAAKHHITVAEIYEGNTADLEKVRNQDHLSQIKPLLVALVEGCHCRTGCASL